MMAHVKLLFQFNSINILQHRINFEFLFNYIVIYHAIKLLEWVEVRRLGDSKTANRATHKERHTDDLSKQNLKD